ncbi:unnamed protein product [Auanema sp. JU1783]|nr:unnamed protein product [Auanema sp. JU1783]
MLGGSLIETPGGEQVATVTKLSGAAEEPQSTDIRKMMTFLGATYFLLMTAFIVPIACVSTVALLLPLTWISMPLFSKLENRLCRFVNDHWVAGSVYSGLNVIEYGKDLYKISEKKCLYLANHMGLLDHFVVMQSLHDKGSVPGRWLWVIYNIWKYTPLGLMWTAHGNFFVNGGASKRDALLQNFKKHLEKYFMKHNYGWVVMYPEGSRLFLITESAKRFAEKNGLKPLEHCAHPRIGAAHAVLDVMAPSAENPGIARCGGGPPVEYIIDATLGYPHGEVPDISSAMMGEWTNADSSHISIHYDVIPVNPEWADEEKLKKFLYERYEIKDKLLKDFYRTGKFPGDSKPVVVPQMTMLISQLFWMGLYYFHYTLWIRPLCSLVFRSIFA